MTIKNLFTENQRFRQIWLWVILVAVNVITIFGAYRHISGGKEFGSPFITGNIFTLVLILLVTGLIFVVRLETTIKQDGIYIRFYPFHLKEKKYSWETIAEAAVRKYNPIMEYGGWGIRRGMFGKGGAYNISGNRGIQLVFKNGDKLLIGTQKPDEAAAVLNQINND